MLFIKHWWRHKTCLCHVHKKFAFVSVVFKVSNLFSISADWILGIVVSILKMLKNIKKKSAFMLIIFPLLSIYIIHTLKMLNQISLDLLAIFFCFCFCFSGNQRARKLFWLLASACFYWRDLGLRGCLSERKKRGRVNECKKRWEEMERERKKEQIERGEVGIRAVVLNRGAAEP